MHTFHNLSSLIINPWISIFFLYTGQSLGSDKKETHNLQTLLNLIFVYTSLKGANSSKS